MPDFASILNRKAEDIRRPPNLPAGHYIASVKALPESAKLSDGKFEKVTFILIVQQACEDVDPDETAAFGKVAGQIVRKDFIFNLDPDEARNFQITENQLKQFLENCAIDSAGKTLGEMINESVGTFVKIEVTHRADKRDPTVLFTDVGRTALA